MKLTASLRNGALAALFAAVVTGGAHAQTAASDPHHPDTTLAQAPPSHQPDVTGQAQGEQPAEPGMMSHGMMGDMPMKGKHRALRMKILFAIADTDGDGALSFQEIMAIHKRIFDKIDANKDGKITPEEVQAFIRD